MPHPVMAVTVFSMTTFQIARAGTLAAGLALAQLVLWKWLRTAWFDWTERHRYAVLAVLSGTWAVSLMREFLMTLQLPRAIVFAMGISLVWQAAVACALLPWLTAKSVLAWVERRRRPASTDELESHGSDSRKAEDQPCLVRREDAGELGREAGGQDAVELGQYGGAGARLSRRVLLDRACGLIALGASTGALGWGMVRGRKDWTTIDVPVRIPRLPRVLDGFTIVQISDLHVGVFMDETDLADGLAHVTRLKPDLIVVTGDIIDHDPHYIPLASRYLGALRARAGVLCALGNHDYYTGADLVLDSLKRAGVDVLRNEGRILLPAEGGGLAVLGVDDLSAPRLVRGRGPDLRRASATIPDDRPTVLLVHQPHFVDKVVGSGVDLQLSGHTHGGQIYPGGQITALFTRYVAGRYDVDGTVLYVNRGFGTAGPPSRVGALPEITRLVLVSA